MNTTQPEQEQEQEPVGYVAENGLVDWNVCAPPILTNLYTIPPAAQRTWVGLTVAQKQWIKETEWTTDELVEWINKKLKESNHDRHSFM